MNSKQLADLASGDTPPPDQACVKFLLCAEALISNGGLPLREALLIVRMYGFHEGRTSGLITARDIFKESAK